MKFFTASTTLLSILVAASTTDAANQHHGVRRSIDFSPVGGGAQNRHSSATLQKRVPLGGLPPAEQPKMMKSLKRSPLHEVHEKRQPEAQLFGSMPILENRGMSSIMGLTETTVNLVKRAWSHDGKQGSSKEVSSSSSNTSSGTDSSSTGSSSTDDSGDDAEECEEDDGEDDAEECEEDDETDDDEEDCEEEEDEDSNDTTTSTSATDAVVQQNAAVKVSSGSSASSSKSASATTSSSTAASSGSSTSSASGPKNTGTATWFTQNGNPGNCGKYNSDSTKLIALYSGVYDGGKNCGRKVLITNLQDGGSVEAIVQDSCPSCGGPQDIDLSVGAMSAIDPNYKTNGIRKIEWHYIS